MAFGRGSRFADDGAMRSPSRRRDQQAVVRGVIIAVIAAVFLGLSGPFGTLSAPLGQRMAYWLMLMLIGYFWGAFVADKVFGRADKDLKTLARGVLVASLIMSAPFTLVVWGGSQLAFGARIPLAALPVLFLSVAMIAAIMTSVNVMASLSALPVAERAGEPVAPARPAPVRFLKRLPLKLRGAEIWAVEAEDHYLRLHTSRGQDLILMRLADAVAELDGVEGMQVHRSWWVARDGIADARRGDGRASLTLKSGAPVPVSRTYAPALRDSGWI